MKLFCLAYLWSLLIILEFFVFLVKYSLYMLLKYMVCGEVTVWLSQLSEAPNLSVSACPIRLVLVHDF